MGDAWEVQLEDLPLPQHVVRKYNPNPNPNPSPSPNPDPNSKGLPLPQHVVREHEAVRREQPTPAQQPAVLGVPSLGVGVG